MELLDNIDDLGLNASAIVPKKSEVQQWLNAHENFEVFLLESPPTILYTNRVADHSAIQSAKTLFSRIMPGMNIHIKRASNQLIHTLRQNAKEAAEEDADDGRRSTDLRSSGTEESDSQPRRLMRRIVDDAVSLTASDIHIECREGESAKVRMRVSGALRLSMVIKQEEALQLAHYAFHATERTGSKTWSPTVSRNSAIDIQLRTGKIISLRLSSVPEFRGFDLIMRILALPGKLISLETAGYTSTHLNSIRKAFSEPYGLIIMSGPTGSGKSTTMLAALEQMSPDLKIISLEAPVERSLDNVSHVTSDEEGLTSLLADVNRWDTNVTVLGELRDPATARALIDMVTSGKLVVTTLHASNALAVPRRMVELGVKESLLADPGFLVAIMNQRLAPMLCENCKVSAMNNEELSDIQLEHYKNVFGDMRNIFFKGTGCKECRFQGLTSRRLVAEIILTSDADRTFLRSLDVIKWREDLISRSWSPIAEHAIELVSTGQFDPIIMEKLVGSLAKSSQTSGYIYK